MKSVALGPRFFTVTFCMKSAEPLLFCASIVATTSAPNFACSSIRNPVSVSPALHGFEGPFAAVISIVFTPYLKARAFDRRSSSWTAWVAFRSTCPLTSIVIDFSGFLYGRSDAWRAIGTPGRMIFFVQVTVCGPAWQVFAHRYMGAPQPHCLKSGWFSLMTATEPG